MLRPNRVESRRGGAWVQAGWALFRKQPPLWLALSFVYLVFAMLLELIPFIGWLVLVLFTPMFLLATLPLARALATDKLPAGALPSAPERTLRGGLHYLRDLLGGALRRLFSGFGDETHLMPTLILSTLLLGGVAGIGMLAALLKVGHGSLTLILLSDVGSIVRITALISLLVILLLTALLLMAFVHTVSLTVFRHQHPLPAIASSFAASRGNFGAFVLFAGFFLLLAELGHGLFFYLSFPLDYLSFLAIGMVALPVLIGGLYASFTDLYTRST